MMKNNRLFSNMIIGVVMAASLTSTGLIAYQSFSPFQQEAVAAAVNDYNNDNNAKTKFGTKTYKVTTRVSNSSISYDVPDGIIIPTPVIGTFIDGGSGSTTSVSINGKAIDNSQTTYKVTSDTLIKLTQSDEQAPAAPASVRAKFDKIKITSQGKPLVFKEINGYRNTDSLTRAGLKNLKIDTGDTNAIVRTRYTAAMGLPTNTTDDATSVTYIVSIDGYWTEFIIRAKDKPITDWTDANKTLDEATKVYKAGKPADISDADWKSFTDAYDDFSEGMSDSNPFHDYIPQWMINNETGKMQAALDKIQNSNDSDKPGDNSNTGNNGNNNGGSDNNSGNNNEDNNKPATVDKTELSQILNDSKTIYDEGGDAYTDASWDAFTTAYTDAEKVNENATATEEQVKSAYDTLKAAKDGLVKNDAGNNDNNAKTPTADELEVLKNLKAYYRTETDTSQGVRHEIPDFDGTKSATYQVEAGYKGSVYPHVDIDGIPQNWEKTYEYDYRDNNSNPEAGVVLIDTVTTPSGAVLKYTFVLNKASDNTQNQDENNNNANNENNSQDNTNNNADNENQNSTNDDSDDVNDTVNNNAGNDSNENNTSTNNNNTGSNNAKALNANNNANSSTQANSKTTDSSGNLAKTGAAAGLIGSISVFLMSAGIMISRVIRRKTK